MESSFRTQSKEDLFKCVLCAIFFVQGYLYSAVKGSLPATKCQSLEPGLNQSLSDSSAYIGDTIRVSCDPGYVLDIGALQKDILCINGSNSPEWNDVVGECILKECPALSLSNNMTTDDTNTNVVIGSNVTVTCDTGHAFSIDLSLNISDRVTSSKTLQCIDDPDDINGKWDDDIGNCSVIECATPYTINNANLSYVDITYRSTIVYTCHSGYMLDGRYTLTAMCNEDATWDLTMSNLNVESSLSCNKRSNYVGCLPASAVPDQDSYTTSHMDAYDCLDYCRSSSYRIASVYENTCTCSDSIADDFDIIDNGLCNVTCAGYNRSNEYQTVYCGGPGPLESVYATVDGCYANVSINEDDSETVSAEEQKTCKERCRVKHFSHAAILNTTCFCVNTSQVNGDEVDSSRCSKKDSYEYLKVQDLAKTPVRAESCNDLYDFGIRMHGTYMLKNGTKRHCYFKDGTVCDDGWIGYNNNCYLFYTEEEMNFTMARDFCIEKEAEMVSILDEEEANFLKEARNLFSDYKEKNWYLGMVDAHNSSLFSWIDGNLFSYSSFASDEPSGVDLCVKDVYDEYFWASADCLDLMYVICKATKSMHKCSNVNVLGATFTRSEPKMTLPYCVEICRGQSASYSAVSDIDCHCLPSIPHGTQFSTKLDCDLPCPGNPYQYCGNQVNFTLIEVSGRRPAKSCEDLQLIGIGDGSFVIKPENDSSLQTCAVPECPYAWVQIRGRCYRFNPYQAGIGKTRKFCSEHDAYPVVLETVQEAYELMDTVANISVYSSTKKWRVGLLSLSEWSGLYRWANGKPLNTALWSNNFTTHQGVEVVIREDNDTEWLAKPSKDEAFICEKGQDKSDYLGCYNSTGLIWDYNTTEYDQMTVQQCVEWCRGGERKFAFIVPNQCACSDNLTEPAGDGFYCYSKCSGQKNQICGGDGVMSVYNVSEYEAFADTCADLFDASIFLSGRYMVGGVITQCNLSDSTTACEPGWVGNLMNCYRYDPVLQKSSVDWWYDNDIVMTSVTSPEEEVFLISYLQRLYLGYENGKILTGLRDMYHLGIYSNQDGLLFKPSLLSGGYPALTKSLNSYVGFQMQGFYISAALSELGFLGKKDKYKLGCYTVPAWHTPVLSSFNSVDLTLCKQLCLAEDAHFAMITHDSCYCGDSVVLAQLTPSDDDGCKIACRFNALQWCGNGTSAVAYSVEEDYAHFAPDCETLYLSGVFYNSTYKLGNESDSRLKTCGFTDGTSCPPTWLGRDGQCYKFHIIRRSFTDARSSCFKEDSYLFNPISSSTVWSLLESMKNMSVLNHIDYLITGVRVVFFNTTYVTADGMRLGLLAHQCVITDNNLNQQKDYNEARMRTRQLQHAETPGDLWVVSNTTEDPASVPVLHAIDMPQKYVSSAITNRTWDNYDPNSELRYMCQKNDDYLGCSQIDSFADSHVNGVTEMSVTMCTEYCRGQDATYFATAATSCNCYNTKPVYTQHEGLCLTPCAGADTQPCGGVVDDGIELFSLFRIPNKTALAKSCTELASYGISHPGEYYIEPGPSIGIQRVSCFYQPPPLSEIEMQNYKHIKVSSSQTDFDISKTFHEYGLHEVWKPESNSVSEHLKLLLKDKHIITGIILSGLHTYSDQSWVTKIKVSYRDLLSGAVVVYFENGTDQIPGNSNGVDESYVFFSKPFVTDEIVLHPLEWHGDVALKVFLLGQLYQTFNHDEFYIGCVMDSIFGAAVLDHECWSFENYDALTEPFVFVDEYACYSGPSSINGFQYGFVDGMCPLNGTFTIGQGTVFKALYRTYEKRCTPPANLTDGQIAEITFPYVQDKYTYGTSAKYTCNIGYEFDDAIDEVTIACRQDNRWDNITHTCSIVSCLPFTVSNGNVTIDSLEYQSEAHVECNSGYWADNGRPNMNVTCQADGQWTTSPTCTEGNLKKNVRYFSSHGDKERDASSMISEENVRSSLDCSVKCTEAYYCRGANFLEASDGSGICRLFTDFANPTELSNNPDWKYYETWNSP